METNMSVAVSLDELTIELVAGDALHKEIIYMDTTYDSHKDSKHCNNEIRSSFRKEPNSIAQAALNKYNMVQACIHSDFEHLEHSKDFTDKNSETQDTIQFEDFEDVPSLSLISSSKANILTDSELEFEVPERSEAVLSSKQESLVSQQANTKQADISSENIETYLKAMEPENLITHGTEPVDLTLAQSHELEGMSKLIHSKDLEKVSTENQSNNKMCIQAQERSKQDEAVAGIDEMWDPVKSQFAKGTELHIQGQNKVFSYASKEINSSSMEAQKPSIVTTAEDWEGIHTVEPHFVQENEKSVGTSAIKSKPLSTFSESWALFESDDYKSVKAQIKTHIERRGFSALTHLLFGPPKLNKNLLQQKELVFCIAATHFDNGKASHIQVLQTIYRCLTGSKFECQRFGNHWEEIGFQGQDPATDLRGTGMLALLHLLYFLRDPSTKELARDVYKLSLHPTQNFPFCAMGINLSKICLQLLREDLFNKACNKRKEVIGITNQVYAVLFLQLYKVWRKGKTISDSGFVLQEVEAYCRKQFKNIFKNFEEFVRMKKKQEVFGEVTQTDPTFFSVCKEEKSDDKSAAELY